jgi:hypothetical protein
MINSGEKMEKGNPPPFFISSDIFAFLVRKDK